MFDRNHNPCGDDRRTAMSSNLATTTPARSAFKRLLRIAVILGIVFAAAVGGVFYVAARNRPNIARNFAAELNGPILAVPEDQRAWPIYREALVEVAVDEPAHWRANSDQAERIVHVKEVIEYLDRQEPTLSRVRKAAKLPALGYALADQTSPEDAILRLRRAPPGSMPPTVEPPSKNPWMFTIICNPCDQTVELSRVLAGHALVSAKRGDTAAAVDDIEAMIGIAQQIREVPFLVTDLASLRQFRFALMHWGRLLEAVPDTFTTEQLLRLERAAKAFGDGKQLVRIDGERLAFADTAQRFFTDDGHGDGRGCYSDIHDLGKPSTQSDFWKSFLQPKPASHSWSRRRNVEEAERQYTLLETELARPYWQCDCEGFRRQLAQVRQDPTLELVALMLSSLPSTHKSQQDAAQQRDALLTASALVRYRLNRKAWPERLETLVPQYMAEIPPDQFTGKPLRYALIAGAPRIYSVGFDKQDDGGTAGEFTTDDRLASEKQRWYLSFARTPEETKGDLILWPTGPQVIPLDPEPPESASQSPNSRPPTVSPDE